MNGTKASRKNSKDSGEVGPVKKRIAKSEMLAVCIAGLLLGSSTAFGQNNVQHEGCVAEQTRIHSFRRAGEIIVIPIIVSDANPRNADATASSSDESASRIERSAAANCQAVRLELRWANGRNNGSMFNVTFLDTSNRPLYMRQIPGFLTGYVDFPLSPALASEPQPWLGAPSLMSVPASVTIQSLDPFASPANLSYTVTRILLHPQTVAPGTEISESGSAKGETRASKRIDDTLVRSLQSASGKLLIESAAYTLSEITLDEPRALKMGDGRKTITTAYRLMFATKTPADSVKKIDLLWIDDGTIPVFHSGPQTGALIYDTSVLRDGAAISLSNSDGSEIYTLPERLKLPESLKTRITPAKAEEGNVVVSIKDVARVIGTTRLPLVQIALHTNRPFPPTENALQLQIGKRFFLQELTGDFTGRMLTLTLTKEMFEELADGADIVAFFDKPDRSGLAGEAVWYFGKLKKSLRSEK